VSLFDSLVSLFDCCSFSDFLQWIYGQIFEQGLKPQWTLGHLGNRVQALDGSLWMAHRDEHQWQAGRARLICVTGTFSVAKPLENVLLCEPGMRCDGAMVLEVNIVSI